MSEPKHSWARFNYLQGKGLEIPLPTSHRTNDWKLWTLHAYWLTLKMIPVSGDLGPDFAHMWPHMWPKTNVFCGCLSQLCLHLLEMFRLV